MDCLRLSSRSCYLYLSNQRIAVRFSQRWESLWKNLGKGTATQRVQPRIWHNKEHWQEQLCLWIIQHIWHDCSKSTFALNRCLQIWTWKFHYWNHTTHIWNDLWLQCKLTCALGQYLCPPGSPTDTCMSCDGSNYGKCLAHVSLCVIFFSVSVTTCFATIIKCLANKTESVIVLNLLLTESVILTLLNKVCY